jgi:hypothetical protein
MKIAAYALAALVLAVPLACSAQVPFERVVGSDSEPANWLTYGGNYY